MRSALVFVFLVACGGVGGSTAPSGTAGSSGDAGSSAGVSGSSGAAGSGVAGAGTGGAQAAGKAGGGPSGAAGTGGGSSGQGGAPAGSGGASGAQGGQAGGASGTGGAGGDKGKTCEKEGWPEAPAVAGPGVTCTETSLPPLNTTHCSEFCAAKPRDFSCSPKGVAPSLDCVSWGGDVSLAFAWCCP